MCQDSSQACSVQVIHCGERCNMEMFYCICAKVEDNVYNYTCCVHNINFNSVMQTCEWHCQRVTFTQKNKHSCFALKIMRPGIDREPGCLSTPSFSRRETLGTCRNSSPYRSTSLSGESCGNTQNRNKEAKLWLSGHPSLPMEIFLRHSQGYNRGLLTMSLGLLNGSVYLNPVEK